MELAIGPVDFGPRPVEDVDVSISIDGQIVDVLEELWAVARDSPRTEVGSLVGEFLAPVVLKIGRGLQRFQGELQHGVSDELVVL